MIKVTVEMWPYGFHTIGEKEVKYTIGELVAYNDGTQDPHISGNYNASLQLLGRDTYCYRSRVIGFDRNEDVFQLLKQILNNAKVTKDVEKKVKQYFKRRDQFI